MTRIDLNDFATTIEVENEGILPQGMIDAEKNIDATPSSINLAEANTKHMAASAIKIRTLYEKYPN